MGGEGRGPSTPAPLLTCARAAVPFVAQAALTAVANAAHGLGCAGRSTHRLQLCPPGPTPHIQVSGCPPGLPSIRVCSRGTHWCVQGGRKHRATHPAAPHSVAPSSPPHRSRSRSPPGPHHSGRGRYSCRLGGGTGRTVLAHGPRRSGGRARPGHTAYLGTGARRLPGHRAHRPCRRSARDTYTPRCRSCRPCTCRGGYRGCWRHQGRLGEGVRRNVRSGLVRSPAPAPLAWTHSILPVAAGAPAQAAAMPWRTPGPLAQSTRTRTTCTAASAQNTLLWVHSPPA